MTEKQAAAIHRTIVNGLVTCDACENLADVLELRATADGRTICSECDDHETGNSPTIETLVRAETEIGKAAPSPHLRRCNVNGAGPKVEHRSSSAAQSTTGS